MKIFIHKKIYVLLLAVLAGICGILAWLVKSPGEPLLEFGVRLLLSVVIGFVGVILAFLGVVGNAGGVGRLHHAPRWFGMLLTVILFGLPLTNGVLWSYLFLTKAPGLLLPWKPMLLSLVTIVALPYISAFGMFGLVPLISAVRLSFARHRKTWLIVLGIPLLMVGLVVLLYQLSQPPGLPAAARLPEEPSLFMNGLTIVLFSAGVMTLVFGVAIFLLTMGLGQCGIFLAIGLQIALSFAGFLVCMLTIPHTAVWLTPIKNLLIPFGFALLCVLLNGVIDFVILTFFAARVEDISFIL